MTSLDVELALVRYLGPRKNLIIPNVSWGFLNYEADLVVVTRAGYLWEIEIKVSKSDLIADQKKRHNHDDPHFSRLYFAMPEAMIDLIEYVPEHAGVILVGKYHRCFTIRPPKGANRYIATDEDRYALARLGALRIWGLKRKIKRLKNGP